MDIQENIKEFSESELERLKRERGEAPSGQEEIVESIDIYQRDQDRIYDMSQKSYPKGSSPVVSIAVASVLDGAGGEGLIKAYKRAQDDVDVLKDQGERGRADLRRQQYMQEYFLPAVELVVNSASPDEVLNSKQALADLDKYVLLEGAGKGYTATYIRQAYGNQLGKQTGRSDASVRSDVMRINTMLDSGQIRTAVGIANKVKDRVDRGESQADDFDYELISRVVSFYK